MSQTSAQKGEQLAKDMANFVNNFNCDSDAFITAFRQQHRTLQQSSMRLMLELIEKIANEEDLNRFTDDRNKQTYVVAKKLVAGFKTQVIKEQLEMGVSQENAEGFANGKDCVPSKFLSFV